MTDLSKNAQVARSPGGNRRCNETLQLKRSCSCHQCQGWRNQRKGQKAQSKTRKALGLRGERFKSKLTNEETWNASSLRVEVKAGAQAQPIATRYVEARTQADAAKSIGDPRPFVMAAVPDGSSPLLVIRADDLEAVVYTLLEEWSE